VAARLAIQWFALLSDVAAKAMPAALPFFIGPPATWSCRRSPNPEIPASTGFVFELKGSGISFSYRPTARSPARDWLSIQSSSTASNEICHRPPIRLRNFLNRPTQPKLGP